MKQNRTLTRGLLLTIFFVGIHPRAIRAHETPSSPLDEVRFDQKLDAETPTDIVLTDEDGKAVNFRTLLDGKPGLLTFAYYQCPNICTLVLNGLTQAMGEMPFTAGKEYTAITVSIDPQDKPEHARAKKAFYLQRMQNPANAAGWKFLTGDPATVKRLGDSVGFHYAYDAEQKQFAHAAGLILLTPEGRVSRYLYGVQYPARDLRLGLIEASANKIGSPVDRLLLRCYHYDPITGKYGFLIMDILRVAAALTAVFLALYLFISLRKPEAAA